MYSPVVVLIPGCGQGQTSRKINNSRFVGLGTNLYNAQTLSLLEGFALEAHCGDIGRLGHGGVESGEFELRRA